MQARRTSTLSRPPLSCIEILRAPPRITVICFNVTYTSSVYSALRRVYNRAFTSARRITLPGFPTPEPTLVYRRYTIEIRVIGLGDRAIAATQPEPLARHSLVSAQDSRISSSFVESIVRIFFY